MGGIDKGLAELDGRPLIEHLLERLRPQTEHILINANRNLERYRSYGLPVVTDPVEGHQGPLAGFIALLAACDDDCLAVLPCDSPLLPEDYLQRLARAQAHSGADIVVAHDGERIQPVHALIGRHLLADLKSFMDQGERKIDLWYARHHWEPADFSDRPETFINLNRPEDYARLESLTS